MKKLSKGNFMEEVAVKGNFKEVVVKENFNHHYLDCCDTLHSRFHRLSHPPVWPSRAPAIPAFKKPLTTHNLEILTKVLCHLHHPLCAKLFQHRDPQTDCLQLCRFGVLPFKLLFNLA